MASLSKSLLFLQKLGLAKSEACTALRLLFLIRATYTQTVMHNPTSIRVAGILLALFSCQLLAQESSYIAKKFEKRGFDDDGNLETLITGETATIPLKGDVNIITIDGLVIYHYDEGVQDVKMSCDTCKFDKKTNAATSNEHVRIEGDDIIITGDNFKYLGKEQKFRILKNARCVIKKSEKQRNMFQPGPAK